MFFRKKFPLVLLLALISGANLSYGMEERQLHLPSEGDSRTGIDSEKAAAGAVQDANRTPRSPNLTDDGSDDDDSVKPPPASEARTIPNNTLSEGSDQKGPIFSPLTLQDFKNLLHQTSIPPTEPVLLYYEKGALTYQLMESVENFLPENQKFVNAFLVLLKNGYPHWDITHIVTQLFYEKGIRLEDYTKGNIPITRVLLHEIFDTLEQTHAANTDPTSQRQQYQTHDGISQPPHQQAFWRTSHPGVCNPYASYFPYQPPHQYASLRGFDNPNFRDPGGGYTRGAFYPNAASSAVSRFVDHRTVSAVAHNIDSKTSTQPTTPENQAIPAAQKVLEKAASDSDIPSPREDHNSHETTSSEASSLTTDLERNDHPAAENLKDFYQRSKLLAAVRQFPNEGQLIPVIPKVKAPPASDHTTASNTSNDHEPLESRLEDVVKPIETIIESGTSAVAEDAKQKKPSRKKRKKASTQAAAKIEESPPATLSSVLHDIDKIASAAPLTEPVRAAEHASEAVPEGVNPAERYAEYYLSPRVYQLGKESIHTLNQVAAMCDGFARGLVEPLRATYDLACLLGRAVDERVHQRWDAMQANHRATQVALQRNYRETLWNNYQAIPKQPGEKILSKKEFFAAIAQSQK